MNKNIFSKMLLILLIPAFGMLFFIGVYIEEKVNILDSMRVEKDSITYLKISEELLNSLQNERTFSLAYISTSGKKYKEDLFRQREFTDNIITEYKKYILNKHSNNIKLLNRIKIIQTELFKIKRLRNSIDEFEIDSYTCINSFSLINSKILDSIDTIKSSSFSKQTFQNILFLSSLMNIKNFADIERAEFLKIYLEYKSIDSKHKEYIEDIINVQSKNIDKLIRQISIENTYLFYEIITENILSNVQSFTNDIDEKEIDYSNKKADKWLTVSSLKVNAYEKLLGEVFSSSLLYIQDSSAAAKRSLIFSTIFWVIAILGFFISIFLLRKVLNRENKNYKNLTKQKQLYNVLTQTNELIIHDYEMDEVFQNVCDIVVNEVGLSLALIGLINSENNIEIVASSGNSQLQDYIQNLSLTLMHDKSHNLGLAAKAIIEARNIIIDDITKDNTSLLVDKARDYQLNSAGAFPLVQSNTIVGVIVVYSKDIKFFDSDVSGLFERMSGYLSFGLDKEVQKRLHKLYEEELRISAYAFESQEAMVITDKEANIVKVNNAFSNMTGYTKSESIGKNPRFLKSDKHESKFFKKMWKDLEINNRWSGEVYNKRKDGEIYPQKTTITAIKNQYNETTHYIGQFYDMSDIKQSEEKLTYQARHDSLTGLPNRLVLKDRLTQAIKSSKRHKLIGSLMFIDLDNFKNINDTLGHDIGDELLKQIASILLSSVREEDSVIRFGGDEFLILSTNLSKDIDEAKQKVKTIANKIREKIDVPLFVKDHKLTTTPSIGITFFPTNSFDANEIIKQADIAMYKAKDAGKNSIQFFTSSQN